MQTITPISKLSPERFETPQVLKKLALASRKLAELKGVAASIPNQGILINALGMQEAKDSSAIENIVTTHDQLFQGDAFRATHPHAAAKEVWHYRQALHVGFELVRQEGLLTTNHILRIHSELERNSAGFRKLPGTALKNGAGEVIYTPPQDPSEVVALMRDLERFINDDQSFDADPLVKMALVHHQFESIHPFYDGNGRTGRIVNVLYLVKAGLLDIPVLYLSRHIVRTKLEYYRLLQTVRDNDDWDGWMMYMLTAVESTATETIQTIHAIKAALMTLKHHIRANYKFYSQDLINSLFNHPYTKIEFLERELRISRLTATKYLDALTDGGVLQKHRIGRNNYYVNLELCAILTRPSLTDS